MSSGERGFTLVEMMVALLISGILVGALFELFAGHGRFVEMQSSREEVQQNSRAALELIGSELRTIPAGTSLLLAADDSIRFRASRVWGVVCAAPLGNTLSITLPAVAGASYSANTGTGLVANLGNDSTPNWTNAVAVSAIGSPTGSCNGSPVATGVEMRTVTMASMPQSGGNAPAIGNVVYLFDEVTYRTGTSSNVPGLWIMRRLGASSNQPMAGPILENGSGLGFSYFSGSSSTPLPTPIANAATRAAVNQVRVVVGAIGRNGQAGSRETQVDTIVISLRNRV